MMTWPLSTRILFFLFSFLFENRLKTEAEGKRERKIVKTERDAH
jgi:hypothetical protein